MAGGVEQRDQAQKSEERAAEQVRLVFFRAVVGTAFFTDDEKGNDQDEEIADADAPSLEFRGSYGQRPAWRRKKARTGS